MTEKVSGLNALCDMKISLHTKLDNTYKKVWNVHIIESIYALMSILINLTIWPSHNKQFVDQSDCSMQYVCNKTQGKIMFYPLLFWFCPLGGMFTPSFTHE
jgi:hypothetical protein